MLNPSRDKRKARTVVGRGEEGESSTRVINRIKKKEKRSTHEAAVCH